ncbi:MAG: SDR family NAD(P)-dependent oxidoreductase [Mycobacterium sp.]
MTATFSEAELRDWLVDYLITNIGCDPNDIDPDSSFWDLRVASRDAIVLSGELAELLGRPVSPVEFWQYPTINALIEYLTAPESETRADTADSADRRWVDEPIAVIGLGCRFPGDIYHPEAFWQFLCEGGSAVGEVPLDRWAPFDNGSPEVEAVLSGTTRWGSFLSEIDAFDADFFEISPREAARMDPQQRLLLEVAHEALEYAGIPADSLRRTQTGVFAGACGGEYAYLATADLTQVDAWSGTGGALSVIANRLSYFFDLRGPSVTVDTACSSSLVAVHLACQSLRTGDSNLAIAAGVNLLLSPVVTRSFDQAEAMSPTGQCHAFDAAADGFVRGEGCGVAVLKRLSDALRDGDRVLAVVRGSAVNQDGRSNGLMAPNPAAQIAVLRAAYSNAGVPPHEVDYVEAHGTGTLLGDPIEARALGTVLGGARPQSAPLLIGAVKSNLGHLEAAAGIAGFIKAVLSVQRGHIPANLNFENPNPHIPFEDLQLKVVAEPTVWPSTEHPRRAGVSSFGFGGTNAHVVLEQGPDPVPDMPTGPRMGAAVTTLVVSGKTAERVALAAGVLAEWMDGDGADVGLADVAHTLDHHRSRHAKFATVCARDRAEAVAGLRALGAGLPADGVVGAHEGPCRSGTVFVYSGQGSQWAGMGRQLLADEPVFAAAVAELEPVFVEQVGFSLQQVLANGEPVRGDAQAQPVIVGLQLALTELWRSYGVEPDAVIGHSMGEVSAAVVAGALSAAEGLRVIATRSRLMAQLAGQGAVALLELDPEGAEALIADYPDVSVAGYSSPRQTVVAGPPEHVDAVIAAVTGRNGFARRVNMEVASHTALMDPILPELASALADLTPDTPTIPFVSTVADPAGPAPVLDAEYWVANVRQPVRFSHAVAAAGAEYGTFVEVSPHPLLTYAIDDTLAEAHHHCIGTLRRDADDTLTFHTSLNATQPPVTEHAPEPHPVLPPTPWRHTRHWISAAQATSVAGHPLLGVGVTDPTNDTRVWERTLSPDFLWLGDHCIDEACVLPAAAYAELALAAVTEAFGTDSDKPWMITELCLHQLMPIGDATVVVTTLSGEESKPCVEIRSGSATSGWTLHAGATLERVAQSASQPPEVDEASATELDADDLYRRLHSAGQQHGPAFQGIVSLTVSDSGAVRAEVRLPSEAKAGSRRFQLHPVMVDIALQTLGATKVAADLASEGDQGTAVVLPVRLAGVRVYGDVTEGVCAVGTLRATSTADRFVGRVMLTGADGQVLLDIEEIEMAVLRAPGARNEVASHMFALQWEPVVLDKPAGDVGALLLVGDHANGDSLLSAVRSGLVEHAAQCDLVSADDRAQLRGALTRKDVSWNAIVVVCPPRSVDEALPDSEQLELAQSRTLLIADIVKTLSQIGARNSPRLWIVTRGAQQLAAGEGVTLAQTTLRGIARVLTFEHPELKATIVDLDPEGGGSAEALVHELCADAGHDEVALRDGRRHVNRLARVNTSVDGVLEIEPRPTVVDLDGAGAIRLQIDQPGRLDALSVHAVQRIPLEDDQVQVRVVAAGLNFSDVLKAMGLYPTLDGSAPVIGIECVGYVTARGASVDSLEIGQRVIAFGPGAFGSHLTTVADMAVPVPDALSDREAAALGIAYLTAWYALREVGRLTPGERVLIHSATGGVGLAAVSIAKMIGARIYTTAGSAAKRELLSGLDVEYVGDSRTVEFAAEILDATDGQGVDVILNSLAGEAIQRGVEILAPGGRFIEIGKRDVYANAQLGLASLAKSASFAVVDLDLNLRLQPQRYRRFLQDILERVVDGQLETLPVTEFSLDKAVDAFRLMASGTHIGKVVISIPAEGNIQAIASPPPQPLVRRDGGYIVVGGMGGLGFVVARWLAQQGAGMVVLNGRSSPSAEVAAAIADMNAAGSRVAVITGDIAEPGTAVRLVSAIEDAGLRPAGVLHSATVLADEIVLNMSQSAAARVFAPKVAGHWWLHEATAHLDLDWWLTFSSAASLLGSPGQGAYAAANSWVDGLVAYRRSRGLPAIGINWGPWAEVGRAQFFADLGFSMITSELGLAAMQQVLAADRCRTGVFSLDARQWFQSFPAAGESSLFTGLAESATTQRRGGGRIRAELDAAEPGERPARLALAIATEIQGVRRSTEPLDYDQPLESLGLDSLMGLELRNRLETTLGITLPVALVWAYPTISALAGALCERMGYEPVTESRKTAEPGGESSLSEEQAEMLVDFVDASELEVQTGAAKS